METSLPKFSRAAQKISVAQNLGGLQPPSPPRPVRLCLQSNQLVDQVTCILKAKVRYCMLIPEITVMIKTTLF